jgi:hypothetical protein
LSDDEVIRLVSTLFIPVAVNLFKIREDQGPGGQLFRSVQRQMDQYQGFWVVSPEGKALAKYHDWEGDPNVPPKKRVPMTLEAGLKAFGPVKPRDVKPTDPLLYRGNGVRPDGSVTLALYSRFLHDGKPDGAMTIDSVTLGASEWAHFAPPEGGVQEWSVPESVARKLGRDLSPGDSAAIYQPEDVREAELKAKVESITGGTARIRLTGTWKAKGLWGGEKPIGASANGEGIAVYDLEKKSMRSLLMVLNGKAWGDSEQSARGAGGVVEWTSECGKP